MYAVIINGSPRVKAQSNTDKIIGSFSKGFCEGGNTCDVYAISERNKWDEIRKAYNENENIIIALPLFVECIPGLLIEFIETLEPKDKKTTLSFILQSGFTEGIQLRCGEAYLEILTEKLGCSYGGTLVKGGNFMFRFREGKELERAIAPYGRMGREFAANGNFFSKKCKRFTGPEIYPKPMLKIVDRVIHKGGRESFDRAAAGWGCTEPLDSRPYEN